MNARPAGLPSGDPASSRVDALFAELVEAVVAEVVPRVLEQLGSQPQASEFLAVGEAAEFLRAKPQRVHDLTSAGVLHRYKDGSRTLISRAELLAYVAGESCPRVAQGSRGQRSVRAAT